MRERQDKVLVKGIHHGEGEQGVELASGRKVRLHVAQSVVHPAHVPFVMEAQSACIRRIGDQRPRGAFLRDGVDLRVIRSDHASQILEEADGVEVSFCAVFVEALLGIVVDAKVHIKDAAHAVHADAVRMELLQPEHGGGEQEASYLSAAKVKFKGAPVRVLHFFI